MVVIANTVSGKLDNSEYDFQIMIIKIFVNEYMNVLLIYNG